MQSEMELVQNTNGIRATHDITKNLKNLFHNTSTGGIVINKLRLNICKSQEVKTRSNDSGGCMP